MQTKTFEVLDEGTFIPVLAVRLEPGCAKDAYLLGRTGYGTTAEQQREYVIVLPLAGGHGQYSTDPYDWGLGRTLKHAHRHLQDHFDDLPSGAVIDVQVLLGETTEAKESEAAV